MAAETTDGRVSTWLAELAKTPAATFLSEGDVVGGERYEIRRELGRGGMGVVYLADDTKLSRPVALKTHQVQSSDWRHQLLLEAQAMAKLSHPNVVAVHDVGEFDGGVFLVADYITGGDLQSWKVPERDWVDVVRTYVEAGRGLAFSHDAGLVHGDFKPANVLMTESGRPQVTDFGLATHPEFDTRDGEKPVLETSESGSGFVGTPAFMAPEQLAGASANAKTDQFSFCVALTQALLGRRPYNRDSRELLTSSEPLRRGSSGVPARLLRVLDRGLSVSPNARYASMSDLLDDLERACTPRRFPWASITVVGLAGAVTLSLARTDAPTCDPPDAPLGAWSDEGRDTLKSIFAKDARSRQRWPRTEETVDRFVDEWSRTWRTVCERGSADSESGLHADVCLDELRRDANATLVSLQGASSKAARAGLQRVEQWPAPGSCLKRDFADPIAEAPFLIRPHITRLKQAMRAVGNDAESGADLEDVKARLEALRPEIETLDSHAMRMRLAFTEVAVYSRYDIEAMEEALKRAYREARAAEDRQHAMVAATNVAELLALHVGDPRAALEWGEVALAESDREGVSRSSVAGTLLTIAIIHDVAGHWDKAAPAYERALEAANALGVDRDRRRANVLISLSGFEQARGNLDRAIETGTEAAETFERLEGGVNQSSLNALSNVGLALNSAGRLDEARELFERELEQRIALLGPENASHIATYLNLGVVAENAGAPDEARRHMEHADALTLKLLGEDHPDRGIVRIDIAWLDMELGKFTEAEQGFEWAHRNLQESVGPRAEKTFLASIGLATARLALGKQEQACSPMKDLDVAAQDALGEGRVLARISRVQADCAAAENDLPSAITLYRRSIELSKNLSGEVRLRLEATVSLASALAQTGSIEEARELAESVRDHEDARSKVRARAETLLESGL